MRSERIDRYLDCSRRWQEAAAAGRFEERGRLYQELDDLWDALTPAEVDYVNAIPNNEKYPLHIV